MIAGIFHQGSGLGNQLHRYVATRVLALDKGYTFRILGQNNFKGKSFMNLLMTNSSNPNLELTAIIKEDGNKLTNINTAIPLWEEKKVAENDVDIRGYDPEFNFIEAHPGGPGLIIDGEFQDERYWAHREKEVDEWLKVEPIEIPDDTCVIGFRGGEYSVFPELFLTKEYWGKAIDIMKNEHGIKNFEVHTDDPELASKFFPEYKIVHNIGINWRSMRYAKHAIIANSSFFIFPRWLRKGITIAPRYWARHNTKVWALSQNYYPRFRYI